jgi:hypothetical protein
MKDYILSLMKIFAVFAQITICHAASTSWAVPLSQQHVSGAKLYANREELVSALHLPPGGIIAEVGVAFGDFSEILIEKLKPSVFVAFDIFDLHKYDVVWGTRPLKEIFNGLTHLEFFKKKLAHKTLQVITEQGLSWECLEKYPDHLFDVIYIDAGHDYESVKRDTEVAKRKIKPDGILIFNDYTMFDFTNNVRYGVVQVVNELVVNENWRVAGFAFHQAMFCDIAIQRNLK